MSAINNNAFPGGFAAPAGGDYGSLGGQPAPLAQQLPGWTDSVRPLPGTGAAALPVYASSDGSGGGLAGFGTMLSGFVDALQNLLASLGQQFGLTTGSGQGAPGQATGEGYFTSADASSVGDPHDAFSGTTASGASAGAKWDDMQSQANLLDSDSFAGGYRVSTTASAPNAQGVALNSAASVALNGGATAITMNGDGSYSISSNGAALSVAAGQTLSLGNGESVTRNANDSLTVDAQTGAGGSLATTLTTNGAGGVDVANAASNVDLGGYLVERGDRAPGLPVSPPRRLQA